MKYHNYSFLLIFSLSFILTSCGGGDGGVTSGSSETAQENSGSQTSAQAASNSESSKRGSAESSLQNNIEGLYSGKTDEGFFYKSLYKDDMTHWSVYGFESNGAFYLHGLVRGDAWVRSLNQYKAKGRDYSVGGTATPAEITASLSQTMVLTGTMKSTTRNLKYETSKIKSEFYKFNEQANISNMSGIWNLVSLESKTGLIAIESSGVFSANIVGCQLKGILKEHATGVNTFKVELEAGDYPCSNPLNQYYGEAVKYNTNTGVELIIFLSTADLSKATVFLARR